MQNLHSLEFLAEAFHCNVLGDPSRTDCGGVYFLVHRGWNVRDIRMVDVCEFYSVINNLIWWLIIVYMLIYLILFGGV